MSQIIIPTQMHFWGDIVLCCGSVDQSYVHPCVKPYKVIDKCGVNGDALLCFVWLSMVLPKFPYHDVIIFAQVKQSVNGGAALGREILEESCDELGG